MSILADLFVADPADAPSYEELMGDALPPERFEVAQHGSFTQLELEILWAIVAGEEWSPETHALEPLGEPAESWLFRFPAPYVERLAQLTPADLPSLATKWAAIEELSCAPADVMPVLESLSSLAQSAQRSGRGLFLWGSL